MPDRKPIIVDSSGSHTELPAGDTLAVSKLDAEEITAPNQDLSNPESVPNIGQIDARCGRKWQTTVIAPAGVLEIPLPDYLWDILADNHVRPIMLAVTITLTTSGTEDRYSTFILSVRLRRGSGSYLHQFRIDKNTIFAGGYFSGTVFTPIGHGTNPSDAKISISDPHGVARTVEISQL